MKDREREKNTYFSDFLEQFINYSFVSLELNYVTTFSYFWSEILKINSTGNCYFERIFGITCLAVIFYIIRMVSKSVAVF